MSKEFIPKTRLQMYKEAIFGDRQNIPDKYFIEETETPIDNEELTTWQQNVVTGNYTASLCDSSIALNLQDVVKIDNVVVPYYDNSATYQTGDLYWEANFDRNHAYIGASVTSVGVSPSGTKHASVYQTVQKFTLLPKTPIETYFAGTSGLFNREDFEFLEPKTINEKLTALECEYGEFDITPKTRTQWYRAKALELVEAVPESKLPPKTNTEKYYAYKAGLYEGELPDPKTVDEYYIALYCGWQPAEDDDSGKDHVPGVIDDGGK